MFIGQCNLQNPLAGAGMHARMLPPTRKLQKCGVLGLAAEKTTPNNAPNEASVVGPKAGEWVGLLVGQGGALERVHSAEKDPFWFGVPRFEFHGGVAK